MYNTYYLRTIAADYTAMLAMGVLLGAIQVIDDQVHAPGGCWDFIGPIHVPTGDLDAEDNPIMTPRLDGDGNEYIHVNLITPVNIKAAALTLAAAHPEIAEGLANLGRYFVTDIDGNAVPPAAPHRVFL